MRAKAEILMNSEVLKKASEPVEPFMPENSGLKDLRFEGYEVLISSLSFLNHL